MAPMSAGVLLYRRRGAEVDVLLVHPGGPFWRNKDAGSWQIPKGLIEPGEDASAAARREVEEELGIRLTGEFHRLGQLRQAGGKLVEAFALEQQVDIHAVESNLFEMEWPPRSGKMQSFPEIDEARWFALSSASPSMLISQRPLLDWLADYLRNDDSSASPLER
ncbi:MULTISPECIES: NUDIX domain-containing protein [unclassified Sphingobium]|uniref:NUDIX domain-containing protein n=1 Tax=unclassified Sphingobium TaxID=2611147 RepID=UPI00044F1150|nr:NUDIX domain-containing protein [Sphingobium sp. Ant17]EXS70478.1 NUDIX hydrolase [Sphingobium sp. Ant17]